MEVLSYHKICLNSIEIENDEVTFKFVWSNFERKIAEKREKTLHISKVADFLAQERKRDFKFNYTLEDFKRYKIPFYRLDERLGYLLAERV